MRATTRFGYHFYEQTMNKLLIKLGSQTCLLSLAVFLYSANAVAQTEAAANTAAKAEYEDKVLVIVNEDVITQSEFEVRRRTVLAEMRQPESALPADFNQNLLDGMISDRLQLQEAAQRELEPSDEEINIGVERYALQQNLTIDQFVRQLAAEGQTLDDFRSTLKDTIALSRLRDYYARARVLVPDYEIDGFLAVNEEQLNDTQYQVSHILIKDPAANRERAEQIRDEIVESGDFEGAARRYSQSADAAEGGVMGWRRAEQLPDVFVKALKETRVGGVTPVLESTNGLHILKLVDLQGERTEVIQHKARHILIQAETTVARAQAAKKLRILRERALSGETFDQLARIYSDDSIAASNGGSLGWVTPGDMVREFEDVMVALPLNEISQPFATKFGMHIMLVEDRRQKNITDEMMRLRADNILRRQRADREFNQWVRQLREAAYVEQVSTPV